MLNELDEAKLSIGELEILETEYETLNNVEEIKEKLTLSNDLLTNEDIGIITNLTELKNQFIKTIRIILVSIILFLSVFKVV